MATKGSLLFRRVGYITLFMSGVFLLLSVENLRSVVYYHGPVSVYGTLFAMSLFCGVSGIGLLMMKKWAVILLFLPGAVVSAIFLYATVAKGAYVPMPWALLDIGFVLIVLGIPALMLRQWNALRW